MSIHITIASRGSLLALAQSEAIASWLRARYSCLVTILPIKTKGDILLHSSLAEIGGKGLFVTEIEEVLLAGNADIAVHSMKDMPSVLDDGLQCMVFGEREQANDIYLSERYPSLEDLPSGAVIGTSSLRRQAQVYMLRKDIIVKPIRGNITTRMAKLDTEYDAIILACAGVNRLHSSVRYMQVLNTEQFLPASGQGALCVEYATHNTRMEKILLPMQNTETTACILAERSFLQALNGGCHIPVAGYACIINDTIMSLDAMISTPDGSRCVRAIQYANREDAQELGIAIAQELRAKGGNEILKECVRNTYE